MALESKIDFMRQMERQLADKVTVADMAKIMTVVSDILEGYEMSNAAFGTPDEKDDLLDSFVSALMVENRSQKTIDRYVYIIGKLMKFAKVPTRKITVYHIRSFMQAEKERNIADSTIEGYREIFSAYFNWLQRENLIERNPTSNLGVVKCAKKNKATFSQTDFERMNMACKTTRDRAIINFLASTGCRVSEVIQLNRNDVRLDTLECVVRGKGNKERTVFLSEVAGMFLAKYLSERTDTEQALFIGKRKERLQPGGIRIMLNVIEKMSGVEHIHPHKFRRTLATELARKGMPIQVIASILGHEKIDTTMEYVMLNKEGVKNDYRRYA